MAERKKLGEMLIDAGLIDQYQLKSALAHQRQWGGRVGANVVKLGFITEEDLVSFLSRNFNLPQVNLRGVRVPPEIIAAVPKEVAKKYGIIPLKQSADKKQLIIAMADPTNLKVLDELRFLVNAKISPVVASDSVIEEALRHYYDQAARMQFDTQVRMSNEIDYRVSTAAEQKKPVKHQAEDGKVDLTSQGELTDEVVSGETDGDEGLDDVLVFSGGSETTISLEGAKEPHPKPPPPSAAPAQAPQRNVAQQGARSGTPSTDELVMALVRVLIDKGFITREELLNRLK